MFDFSEYPQVPMFFDLVNKKLSGKMKDKFKGNITSGFVRFKSKMYCSIDTDNEEDKKAKEFKKNVVSNVRHKECTDVWLNEKIVRDKMERIHSN